MNVLVTCRCSMEITVNSLHKPRNLLYPLFIQATYVGCGHVLVSFFDMQSSDVDCVMFDRIGIIFESSHLI